jgi:hypothetical protein
VLKYFGAEEHPEAKLPKNFMDGFLEVSRFVVFLGAMDEI